MYHGAFYMVRLMAERKKYDPGLVKVGELISNKRKALGDAYKTREGFIEQRSEELFGGDPWISLRHLANIELGKNWISIEKLIILSVALEENPVVFFEEIVQTYQKYK